MLAAGMQDFRDGEIVMEEMVAITLEAARAETWSGAPKLRRMSFTNEKFSKGLFNGEGDEVLNSDLTEVVRHVLDDDDIQPEVAIALLQLGYQMSRNGEDSVIGVLRIGLWRKAL